MFQLISRHKLFSHHVRAHIAKDPDTSARLALVLTGMRPWLFGRLGSII